METAFEVEYRGSFNGKDLEYCSCSTDTINLQTLPSPRDKVSLSAGDGSKTKKLIHGKHWFGKFGSLMTAGTRKALEEELFRVVGQVRGIE